MRKIVSFFGLTLLLGSLLYAYWALGKSSASRVAALVNKQGTAGQAFSTIWSGLETEGGGVIEWRATINVAQSRHFIFTLRSPDRLPQEFRTHSPKLQGDDRQVMLAWIEAEQEQGRDGWWTWSAKGTRSDLESLAAKRLWTIQLGNRFFGLQTHALEACEELLRRSDEKKR